MNMKSNLLGKAANHYLEYYIPLKKWAAFFGGQEAFKFLTNDIESDYNEIVYESNYQNIANNEDIILDLLVEYSLKEYNYNREFRLKDCKKADFEEQKRLHPKIENRTEAVKFFRLNSINVLNYQKDEKHYTIFDISVILSEKYKHLNLSFSIILLGNEFIVCIDSVYSPYNLYNLTERHKNGEPLDDMTSMRRDYMIRVRHDETELYDYFSSLRFRGRSVMSKFKELLPYGPPLGIRTTDAVPWDKMFHYKLPPSAKVIGYTGGSGKDKTIFFILKRTGMNLEESPIYSIGYMDYSVQLAPLARNLVEFISLGAACCSFYKLILVSICSLDEFRSDFYDLNRDADSVRLVRILWKHFPLIAIENPYHYIKKIQTDEVFIAETKGLSKYIFLE